MNKIIILFCALFLLTGCYDREKNERTECYTVIAFPDNAPILLNKCTGDTWTFRGNMDRSNTRNNFYWWHPIQREKSEISETLQKLGREGVMQKLRDHGATQQEIDAYLQSRGL